MKTHSNKLKQVTDVRAPARTEIRPSIFLFLNFWYFSFKRKGLGQAAAMSGKEDRVIKITNPFPHIENFFQTLHLQECRNLLRDSSIRPYPAIAADLLRFLEELEKVTEAMWVTGEKERGIEK